MWCSTEPNSLKLMLNPVTADLEGGSHWMVMDELVAETTSKTGAVNQKMHHSDPYNSPAFLKKEST
jgi:hypothetical protein